MSLGGRQHLADPANSRYLDSGGQKKAASARDDNSMELES